MDPIKEYVDIGLVLAGLIAIGLFLHHVRVGAQQELVVAQQAADLKEATRVAKVNADATVTINDLQARLSDALVAPTKPSVSVRVCLQPRLPSDGGSASPSPGPLSYEAGGPSGGVGSDDLSLDIAPPTEAILKRDKAVIDYLQGYVRTCQTAGLCAKK